MTDDLHALAEVDRTGRIGRTTQQVGIPAAILTLLVWLLRLFDVDLNPAGDEEEVPADVATALLTLITVALAFRMNRRPPDQPSPAHDVVEVAAEVGADRPLRARQS